MSYNYLRRSWGRPCFLIREVMLEKVRREIAPGGRLAYSPAQCPARSIRLRLPVMNLSALVLRESSDNRKMCGVVPQSWQGGRCAPPLHPPGRGVSKASSLYNTIQPYRRLSTRTVWPLHHQSGSLRAAPTPHDKEGVGLPLTLATKEPSSPLEPRQGLSRPSTHDRHSVCGIRHGKIALSP